MTWQEEQEQYEAEERAAYAAQGYTWVSGSYGGGESFGTYGYWQREVDR